MPNRRQLQENNDCPRTVPTRHRGNPRRERGAENRKRATEETDRRARRPNREAKHPDRGANLAHREPIHPDRGANHAHREPRHPHRGAKHAHRNQNIRIETVVRHYNELFSQNNINESKVCAAEAVQFLLRYFNLKKSGPTGCNPRIENYSQLDPN